MAVNAGTWVIRPEDRYQIKYDYRGGGKKFQILKNSLASHAGAKLVDRVLESPLGNIYKAMENFHYSSTVAHHLLIRSVYTDRDDELRFRFRDSVCRFGRVEFALITGLYFGIVDPDIRHVEERNHSSLIECKYHVTSDVGMTTAPFSLEVSHITIDLLEKALTDTKDAEIAYKLGLIYLIESVLHGKASSSNVSPFVFLLVDDIPQFLHYSWGSYFWDVTLKNLKGKRDGLTSHIGRNMNPTKDVACMINALFVWAYETVPSVGFLIARYVHSMAIPRMLRWHPVDGNIKHNVLNTNLNAKGLEVTTYLKPSDEEVKMLRGIGLADDEINTPPPVYKVPRDKNHPTVGGSMPHAPRYEE